MAARGLGKVGGIVKGYLAERRLPENLRRLHEAIKEFQPTKRFHYELDYQRELTGFLRARFGSVAVEEQRGRSRPDIVVFEIAIEVKGPTTNHELKTIADKIVRYHQHFQSVVCVLFDVQDEQHFEEWLAGMARQFPHVVIIRK